LPTNVDVTVSGPKSIIETMDGREIAPFIKLEKDAPSSEQELKVECHISKNDVKLLSVSPATIKVSSVGEK
ncbi:MAG TPA: CdaR family protein, partial [Victivallales bacterium]|nr:CdaR family protein [Victivallales bacterium]